MYYRDINAAILCFDITSQDTFEQLDFWIKDLKTHAPANYTLIVCGTKADLDSIREVSSADAESWCSKNNT